MKWGGTGQQCRGHEEMPKVLGAIPQEQSEKDVARLWEVAMEAGL